jgi:hypothetical protein
MMRHAQRRRGHESRDLQSPGSCRGFARSPRPAFALTLIVAGCRREVALFKGASGSCRRGLHDLFARPLLFLAFVVLLTGLVAGCAGKNFAELRPGLETRGAYIEGVPFYKQSEDTCGPAALASILAFRGHPESLESITERIYLPELRGTLPMDMEAYAQKAGFRTKSMHGAIGELKAHIRNGKPVIAMLDLGYKLYRKPHYVDVIGYDDGNEVFIVHDGSAPNSLISYNIFNKRWVRAGYWMLVIEPGSGEASNEK